VYNISGEYIYLRESGGKYENISFKKIAEDLSDATLTSDLSTQNEIPIR
jgi:hypothetical protein